MSFNLQEYFRKAYNKKRVHIEQLRTVRDQKDTNAVTRHRLDSKIAHEQHQLSVLAETWDVR